jgi:hypothetical protein
MIRAIEGMTTYAPKKVLAKPLAQAVKPISNLAKPKI